MWDRGWVGRRFSSASPELLSGSSGCVRHGMWDNDTISCTSWEVVLKHLQVSKDQELSKGRRGQRGRGKERRKREGKRRGRRVGRSRR